MRSFIPNFAEIMKLIIDMIKKNNEVKLTEKAKASFACIKTVISEAPVLKIPDYLKYFLIFLFTSKHTVAIVIL